MRIVVCVKQVLDPELPQRDFRLDPDGKEAAPGRASRVISTFDEIALEVALQLREKAGGGQVTALTLGGKPAEEALRKALAMTADAAVRVDDDGLGAPGEGLGRLDGFAVAAVLAAAIRRLGGADLVLCGRQAADTDAGQVGLLLAEELGVPTVASAVSGEPAGEAVRLKRETPGGYEVVEARLPALATVTNADVNVPRIPKVKDVMASFKKPLTVWTAADLGVDPAATAPRVALRRLFIPERETACEMVGGDSPEAQAEALAERILALKVLETRGWRHAGAGLRFRPGGGAGQAASGTDRRRPRPGGVPGR